MNGMSPGLAYQWNFTDKQYTDIDLSLPIYRPIVSADIKIADIADRLICICRNDNDTSISLILDISADTNMPTLDGPEVFGERYLGC